MAKTKPVVEAAALAIAVGGSVTFLGYADDVKPEERVLTKDTSYPVVELVDGGAIVKFPNPDFNAKKKEDAEKNPKFLETEVFAEEVTVDAPAADAAPVVAPTVTKVKSGKAPKAPAPVVKAEKPAKAAKPPKVKAEPKVKPPKEEVDDLPTLTAEQEDADVLAIVSESQDLVATAQDLEGDIGRSEYHMGGVLYHIKKSGSYKDLNPAYKENAGFAKFLSDYMNVDYRKAMNLIDIYVTFSTLGIENPAERVATIGWTKASKITRSMSAEGVEPEDLLKLAEENTVADLSIAIKEQTVNVGGTPGEQKKRITMKFRYFEEEGVGLVGILKAAQEQQSLKNEEEALAFILNDWATTSFGEAAEVADAPVQTAPVGNVKAKSSAKPTPKAKAAA
jgi:hypothetical protein